jgi:predicted nucleotidyltransferase
MHSDIMDVLEKAKHRIVSKFHPQRIILFGSYSNGRPGPDMDFLVLTPEQYDRQKDIIGTVVRQANQEGKVIYDHAIRNQCRSSSMICRWRNLP